jgi:hypothetical protein
MPLIVLAALVLIAASPLGAQSPSPGLPALLPRAEEIALARSAAPPSVSDSATVFVLERGGFVLAERGSNGVTCLVNRSHPEALEPHCYDAEGSRTIVPIRLAEAKLREAGRSNEEIEAAIAAGIRNGGFELPARAVMSYMMSSAQVLHDDAGRRVGAWKPHLMIYMPYVRPADLGVSGSGAGGAPVVADAGGALASVVVVVPEFVDPKPPLPGGP